MRKLFFLMMLLCASTLFLAAQNRTVTGSVADSSGQPISQVSVLVTGTRIGTVTNNNGNFSLSVPANATTLDISYVGYGSQRVTIPASGVINVILTSSSRAATLDEVVVTGYSTIQRKKFSGATTQVNATEVRKQPLASFDQALQGQAAGVSVLAQSGQPGANGIVRIRGNGSISGGNVPLYILDGVQISAADFASMNQGDFESVEILKDAVATAMYGSRGANGVIVITTRRGRAGTLQFNYDGQHGWSEIPEDRLVMMTSAQKIDYEIQRGNPYQWPSAKLDSLRNVNFNWRDALFRTGITQQHMISASGGSAANRFFGSLSYMDQQGTLKTTGLQRYTARVSTDNSIKNFRFGLGIQGGYAKTVGTSEGQTFTNEPLNAIRWANPYDRDIDPNTGTYQQTYRTNGTGTGQFRSGQPNPALELFENYNWNNQIKGIATSYLEFHFPFVQGLFARTNWGIDYVQNEGSNFGTPLAAAYQANQGFLNRAFNRNLRYTGTTSLNYKKAFGRHEFDGGLFTEVVKSAFRSFNFTGRGFTNGFRNEAGITPGSAAQPGLIPTVGGTGTANGILSYFTILNYGYNSKYYLTLVGRRDGSSRFGINNRWANFGSVGVNWVVTQEDFMRNLEFVNDFRVRASYGTTGSNNVPLTTGDFPIPTFGRTSYAGTAGWTPSTPGNLDYSWEINRTINFGIDWTILNRRLSGSLDLYDRETQNLFYSIPIDPSISGFASVPGNFGTLRNRGFEFMLKGDVIRTRSFTWNLQGNLTLNRNTILDLPQDSVLMPGATNISFLAENHPLNALYLVRYAGVNSANGNALYYKRDGSITQTYSANDRVYVGTSDAPWFGGVSTSFTYRGFDLGAQLNFFIDRVMYNNDRNNVTNPDYYTDNMSVDVLREWKQPGDITDVPRPSSSGGNAYQAYTTRFLEDADFIRLRNVTLGYNFSPRLLGRAKIRSARIFFQGQNLWTHTVFKSFDPEMVGVSLVGGQYPALVQKTIGLSIGF